MTTNTNTELPPELAAIVNERVHGLDPAGIVVLLGHPDDSGFAYPRSLTLGRGQELLLTEEILLASLDRKGGSFWALDEYQQRERYNGVPRWGFGPYPESERAYDRRPDLSDRYVTESRTIAQYRGNDRADAGVHVPLRTR